MKILILKKTILKDSINLKEKLIYLKNIKLYLIIMYNIYIMFNNTQRI